MTPAYSSGSVRPGEPPWYFPAVFLRDLNSVFNLGLTKWRSVMDWADPTPDSHSHEADGNKAQLPFKGNEFREVVHSWSDLIIPVA